MFPEWKASPYNKTLAIQLCSYSQIGTVINLIYDNLKTWMVSNLGWTFDSWKVILDNVLLALAGARFFQSFATLGRFDVFD